MSKASRHAYKPYFISKNECQLGDAGISVIYAIVFQLLFVFSLKVLSTSVSKGLKFYRTCPQLDEEIRLQFQNSQPLEEIVQLLNDTFDSMNARCPRDGVTMDNWPMKKEVFF